MPHSTVGFGVMLTLAVVKTLVLVAGGIVTFYAARAYRRTGRRALGLLAAGLGTITLGVFLAGLTFEVLALPLAVGILIEGVFVLCGFLLIAASLKINY